MSFLVCHMEKHGKYDLKGLQFHDQRERESKTNPDIDHTRTHLNYDLHNEGLIDFNKVVNEKINHLDLKKKIRKDAVVLNEFVVTSDKGFFDKLSPEDQKRFFQEGYNFLANRYGQENVVHANVHMDEKTPHMHIGIVPIINGKLCSKDLFTKTELINLQSDFVIYMQKRDFDIERGEGTSGKHIETKEFKLKTLKEEIEQAQSQINALEGLQKSLDDINIDLGKKTLLKDEYKLKKSDVETVLTLAKKSVVLEKKVDELQEQNKKLLEDKNKAVQKFNEVDSKYSKLTFDYYYLNEKFEKIVNWIRDNGLYKHIAHILDPKHKDQERELGE